MVLTLAVGLILDIVGQWRRHEGLSARLLLKIELTLATWVLAVIPYITLRPDLLLPWDTFIRLYLTVYEIGAAVLLLLLAVTGVIKLVQLIRARALFTRRVWGRPAAYLLMGLPLLILPLAFAIFLVLPVARPVDVWLTALFH